MKSERYIQLNEHLKEAHLELGDLYKELSHSPDNAYIKEAIELVRQEKMEIIKEMQEIERVKK